MVWTFELNIAPCFDRKPLCCLLEVSVDLWSMFSHFIRLYIGETGAGALLAPRTLQALIVYLHDIPSPFCSESFDHTA